MMHNGTVMQALQAMTGKVIVNFLLSYPWATYDCPIPRDSHENIIYEMHHIMSMSNVGFY